MMKAQVITNYCEKPNLILKDVAKPSKLQDQEVLVKMKVASLNPGDAIVRAGKAKMVFKISLPCILGLEGTGTVEAVGEKVTKFKPGDDVVGLFFNNRTGSYAEYALFLEEELVKKPTQMTFEQAAALPTVGGTVLEMFRKHAAVKAVINREMELSAKNGKLSDKPAEKDRPALKIIVIGASGGCGSAAVLFAKGFLSRYFNVKVYAVCSGRNSQTVTSLGADVVIDYTKTTANAGRDTLHPKGKSDTPSICEIISKQHGDTTVDLVCDCVGGYYFYDDVCRNLKCTEGNHQVVYSAIAPPSATEVNIKTLLQLGSFIGASKLKSCFSGYPSYYFVAMSGNAKDLNFTIEYAFMDNDAFSKMPITPYALKDVNEAHLMLESKRTVGKLILNIQ